ncbi:MAG: hypothetical protein ACLVIY_07610 [Anaerobutyricum soehngenii]
MEGRQRQGKRVVEADQEQRARDQRRKNTLTEKNYPGRGYRDRIHHNDINRSNRTRAFQKIGR